MSTKNRVWRLLAANGLLAIGLVITSLPATATEQAEQRRAARDVRQDTRQSSRAEKIDCRAENNKSNAQCRQDKRHAKQDGRQTARDIKY
ncbi:MAG: hypothetical protein J0M01_12810 [Dechloromonas sp.]|jgi:hypothetical protein|nr:hypothetical protein [Dechloromonas sp.]